MIGILIHFWYTTTESDGSSGGAGGPQAPYFWKSNRAPLSPSYEREEEGENERPEEEGESPP
jgi:hypothetical protein